MRTMIPSLNGLRAISIIMVVCGHLLTHGYFPSSKILHYAGMLFFNGQFAVNIFFIISGFIITTLLTKERENSGDISLKDFYFRRMIRIFPAYYFLVFVYLILQKSGAFYIDPLNWMSIVTFTKQFFPSDLYETGHFWSLSVEEVFYLVWPWIFIQSKNTVVTCSFIIIMAIAITRFLQFSFPVPGMTNTIFTTADSLIYGCLLAVFYDKITTWVANNKNYIYLVVVGLAGSLIGYFYVFHLIDHSNSPKIFFLARMVYALFGNIGSITNLCICFIIVFSINIKNVWFRFLNSPVMNHIGKLSYSIYLWQQLYTGERLIFHKMPLIVLALCIYVTAYISYRFVEKPFLSLKKRLHPKTIIKATT